MEWGRAEQQGTAAAAEAQPETPLLHDFEKLAEQLGGPEYMGEFHDSVEASRGYREWNSLEKTTVKFSADRMRNPANPAHFYVEYIYEVKISRQLEALPPEIQALAALHYDYESPSDTADSDTLTKLTTDEPKDVYLEIYRQTTTLHDDDFYFSQEVKVSYAINDLELDFVDEDESDDEESADGPIIIDVTEGEASYEVVNDETFRWPYELLNEAWEVIEASGKQINAGELPLDVSVLTAMARMQHKLEVAEIATQNKIIREKTGLVSLLSLAEMEIHHMYIDNTRRSLKMFFSGEKS